MRLRSSRVEIENENVPRSRAGSFRNRKGRKLSLVEELAQTYELDETYLDSSGLGNSQNAAGQSEMMIIPEGRKSQVRADLSDSSAAEGLLSGLTEMKGEVRREIEVMNMKMTQLEEQIGTILSILKSQGALSSPTHSLNRGRDTSTSYFEDNGQSLSSCDKSDKLKAAAKSGSKEEEGPLPDWLAKPQRSDSVPDWEDAGQEERSASAARLLNADEPRPAAVDPRLLKTINLMTKK